MIKLLDYYKRTIPFKTTIFPDKTSQIWQIEETSDPKRYNVLWQFESESEVVQLCQLLDLLHEKKREISLIIPYLPYARQDKAITNESTFALRTLISILNDFPVSDVVLYDAHSDVFTNNYDGWVKNKTNRNFIDSIWKHDVICFPDKGAQTRYFDLKRPSIAAEKTRDQLTGAITGIQILPPGNYEHGMNIEGQKVLIVDDLADGGGTFIALAEELKKYNPKQIDLAVSHGIFSKGVDILYQAGISNIYTTNSLPDNEGYDAIKEMLQ